MQDSHKFGIMRLVGSAWLSFVFTASTTWRRRGKLLPGRRTLSLAAAREMIVESKATPTIAGFRKRTAPGASTPLCGPISKRMASFFRLANVTWGS